MVYRGQIYRKVGEDDIWEVIKPQQDLRHEIQWLLGKLGSNIFMHVHESDLEIRELWDPVRDT